MMRCSLGTAKVLGLKRVKVDALPTTAYLMVGERCRFDCAFCAQARESTARADLLSRVSWPAYSPKEIIGGLSKGDTREILQRICFQVVQDNATLLETKELVQEIRRNSDLPVCVSAGPKSLEEVGELLELGVEHVSIALDAATPEVYDEVKDGSWQQRYALLAMAAMKYPGHMATHLIVGLGESERDMVLCIQDLYDKGVTVALFAFTPIRGTRLELSKPPEMSHYRRVQAAHYLIRRNLARADQFVFHSGKLLDFGILRSELKAYLADGEAFRTSGCDGCNRPYYNEVPGHKELYNYPRPLTEGEKEAAWERLLQ
ncbi:MAG: radical SAM protein [Desulfitobacteriaceae bacterium]